jgi:CRP-like cAMP-binding protein
VPANARTLRHLRHLPLFASCSRKDLERIARAGDETMLASGTTMIRQGDVGREAFIILSGKAVVRRGGKRVATVGAGSVVGELSLFDHGPRTATVVCDTDCHVLVLSQRHFLGLLDRVPALSHKLFASLATRIRDLDRAYLG